MPLRCALRPAVPPVAVRAPSVRARLRAGAAARTAGATSKGADVQGLALDRPPSFHSSSVRSFEVVKQMAPDGHESAQALGVGARSMSRTNGALDMRAVWQLTSMCVGAGVFTIPQIFVKLGSMHASLWVVFMGCLANLAMQRLLDASEMYSLQSYECLAERAFGSAGKAAMVAITLICTSIATLSYINTAKDLLVNTCVAFLFDVDVNAQPVKVLDEAKTFALLSLQVGVLIPSLMKPTIGGNAWISKLGVVSVFSAAAFFIIHCFTHMASRSWRLSPVPGFAGSPKEVLDCVATLAFSYSMVFAVFPVLQERCDDAPVAEVAHTLRRPVAMSVSLSCSLYLVIGLVGAYTFGLGTDSFSLQNLPLTEPLTQVITLLMGVSVELLASIVAFPAVQSLLFVFSLCFGDRGGRTRFVVVLLLAIMVVFVDAFITANATFALCGALGLSLGAYVMPCVIFFSLAQAMTGVGLRVTKTRRILTSVVLLFGFVLLFGSTPVILIEVLQPKSDSDPTPVKALVCRRPDDDDGTNAAHAGDEEPEAAPDRKSPAMGARAALKEMLPSFGLLDKQTRPPTPKPPQQGPPREAPSEPPKEPQREPPREAPREPQREPAKEWPPREPSPDHDEVHPGWLDILWFSKDGEHPNVGSATGAALIPPRTQYPFSAGGEPEPPQHGPPTAGELPSLPNLSLRLDSASGLTAERHAEGNGTEDRAGSLRG